MTGEPGREKRVMAISSALEHVRDVMDERGIDSPAIAALLELRGGRGELVGQDRRQVAEVRVGRQRGERVENGRGGTEVHLGHCRAEPAGTRSGPLVAAAGTEHRYGGGVDGLTEGFWHIDILAPGPARPGWGKLRPPTPSTRSTSG